MDLQKASGMPEPASKRAKQLQRSLPQPACPSLLLMADMCSSSRLCGTVRGDLHYLCSAVGAARKLMDG